MRVLRTSFGGGCQKSAPVGLSQWTPSPAPCPACERDAFKTSEYYSTVVVLIKYVREEERRIQDGKRLLCSVGKTATVTLLAKEGAVENPALCDMVHLRSTTPYCGRVYTRSYY